MEKKIAVANWKMNPQTFREAEELLFSIIETVKEQKSTKVILCPPFVWLTDLSHKYKNDISFGAQDVFWEDSGAYTGEISPKMLSSSGVEYVIIGHSERRALGETDEMINKKLKAALRNGLTPILAVGEKKKSDNRKEILSSQLDVDLKGIDSSKIIIVYEPVWAIGTGDAETPEHTIEAVKIIKSVVGDAPVLYGGSIDSKNVADFISKPEIGGVLVGGASVDQKEFKKIMEIVSSFQ
ncbi:MAG: triose-phosphate isomerase [Patescibacteria group bacterium]